MSLLPDTFTNRRVAVGDLEINCAIGGDGPPVLTLTGSHTGLSNPNGIAVDVAGDVFVANTNAGSVTEYAPEMTGDAPPHATIAVVLTRLDDRAV
jgi:hypothetical protein